MGVRVHLAEVPLQSAPAAGVVVKTHALDVETGDELCADATRCTGLVSAFRGKVAVVEQTLVFAAPLQLALQRDVLLLFEIVVPKVAKYSSCYAKLGTQNSHHLGCEWVLQIFDLVKAFERAKIYKNLTPKGL